MSRIQCQNLKFKLVLKAERVYCYDWADLVCVCVCPSDPMYTTSETLRLSLTMAQMLDYMTDNHINDILMFQQFLLLHTFLGVSKSLPNQSVQGPKKQILSFSIPRTKQYKQGNYSLRRPPKLIIPQIFIEQLSIEHNFQQEIR